MNKFVNKFIYDYFYFFVLIDKMNKFIDYLITDDQLTD